MKSNMKGRMAGQRQGNQEVNGLNAVSFEYQLRRDLEQKDCETEILASGVRGGNSNLGRVG